MVKLVRLVAAVVVVAALGGCSDDEPEPRIEPSESASTPSSPTSTPPETTEPADPRAIERAFVDTFVQEISASLSTGDPSGFMNLSSAKCESCQSLATNLTEAYRDGGRITGGEWHVSNATYVRQDDLGSIWNVDVNSSRERWLDGNGDTTRIIRAGVQRFVFAIHSDGSTLVMRELRTRS